MMAASTTREYISSTDYSFDETDADAIIRIAAYHRKDFCLAVIWFNAHEHHGIRHSIATPFPRTSTKGLGHLGRLPLELLYDTLVHLDIRSFLNFRQVNLKARQITDSIQQYQIVVLYGLNLLCALLRTRLAPHTSLFTLYEILRTKSCSLCGHFSGFVSLLTLSRYCFKCLQEAYETKAQTVASIQKHLGLNAAEVTELRKLRTLPGFYSMKETPYKSRSLITSTKEARSILKKYHETPLATQSANQDPNLKFTYMSACALPYYDIQGSFSEHGVCCAGCQAALEKDVFSPQSRTWAYQARDHVYDKREFLDHFKQCQQAQSIWKSCDKNRLEGDKLPAMVKHKGFFDVRDGEGCGHDESRGEH